MEKIKLAGKIKEEIEKLLNLSEEYVDKELGIHEIEKGLLHQLLQLGLVLLKVIIEQKIKKSEGYILKKGKETSYKKNGFKERKYLSIFGGLSILRPSYLSENLGQFHKLDEYLKLPIGIYWSYNIQELVGESSSESDYAESIKLLNKLLDLGLSGKSSERNANRLGKYVDDFYEHNNIVLKEEGLYFSAGFDGKGVPKIKPSKEIRDNPKERLKRGEKKGVKQMATVSVTSSFTPQQRSYESIILGLMGKEKDEAEKDELRNKAKKTTDNRLHKNIHRRAFLADQDKAIEYGIQEIKSRMTNPKSRFIVPIDAGIGLEDKVMEYIKKYNLKSKFDGIILDIVHVSEYVWDAATAIFGERSKFRRDWVKEVLTDLLESKTLKVIEDLKLHYEKTSLSANKKKQIKKAITYFTNHQHKMNYKWFLKKGYPISSSIVESTCKHLVKDRMEQSGMRWSSQGAQNMMNLRAVKINGDINEFMNFVIQKDRKVELIKSAA